MSLVFTGSMVLTGHLLWFHNVRFWGQIYETVMPFSDSGFYSSCLIISKGALWNSMPETSSIISLTRMFSRQLRLLLVLCTILFPQPSNGNAGVTSSFMRSLMASVDMPLDNEVFAIPKGYNAPEQVHITQGDYEGKAVIVSWLTSAEPGSSEVFYDTVEHNYKHRAKGNVTTYTFFNYTSGFIHHCLINDLEYDTKYYYRIGNESSAREFSFSTPPEIAPDAPYTFGIIGDMGQTFHSLSTFKHYLQSNGQAVLYVGDLSYADNYEYDNGIRWDTWGRFIEPSAAYQPWIWTAGNHEIEYRPKLGQTVPFQPYLHRYQVPYIASGSTSPLWYSVKRASAHIIVLSSYSPFAKYSPQWVWLKSEIQHVDREKTPWLIVLMHAPLYNSNSFHYMEGESMRTVFESWFIKYKVDIIFAGHVHAYERSYRMSNVKYNITNGACKPEQDESAPVYITVGDGGNLEGLAGPFKDPQPAYSAFREASYGHAMLEIKNRSHAYFYWNRNEDGVSVASDSLWLYNQHWWSKRQINPRRRLKKSHDNMRTEHLGISFI